MRVADLNPDCNPELTSNASSEELCRQIDEVANALKHEVTEAARRGESFDSVERKVHETVFAMGKQFVDLFIGLQRDGDLGQTITTEDHKTLFRSSSPAQTHVRSIFGLHRFSQFTYAPGAKRAIALRPISARMSLPTSRWSYLLQQWTQMLAVDSAFQQAMDNLRVILGGEK